MIFILGAALMAAASDFNGARALESTRQAVALGPRPAGSAAIVKLQAMIRTELRGAGWSVTDDAFAAATPVGRVPMRNIIGKLSGSSGRAIVYSGHYDTKAIPGMNFVGANDGGSSTGWLLEMARVLPNLKRKDDVYVVFFDGEEAFGQWSETNGTYGSRHLAERWRREGTLARIRALFNVDMIGDKQFTVVDELNSSIALRKMVRGVARELGHGSSFPDVASALEDDHLPFVRLGVNAVDLIDFDYGPSHSWWHTEADTMDKLSSRSLQIIGDVLLEVYRRLQQ
ncbi:MAG TPA: M28 family peptidase [Bryobacteraceae bacterium]|nr:M28 family peptidase [Bryobacteraceae bacterium]